MICHIMRWTYQEFMSQPVWFIEYLQTKLEVDAEHQEEEMKKAKRKAKRK